MGNTLQPGYSLPQVQTASKCDNCSQSLGAELLNCNLRNLGKCPFRAKTEKFLSSNVLGYVVFGMGSFFALLGLTLLPFGLIFSLFGLLFAFIGGFIAFGKRTSIFNKSTGQLWQQASLFGFVLSQTVSSHYKWLYIETHSESLPQYPASLIALSKYYNSESSKEESLNIATEIFLETLLDLKARQFIEIKYSHTTENNFLKTGKDRLVFIISPGVAVWQSTIYGELEDRIIRTAVEWDKREDTDIKFKNLQHSRWTSCYLTLADMITIVFEGKQNNPANWLTHNLIGSEVTQNGWGQLRGNWIQKKLQLNPQQQILIANQHYYLEKLSTAVTNSQAEIISKLRQEIYIAIKSCEDSD